MQFFYNSSSLSLSYAMIQIILIHLYKRKGAIILNPIYFRFTLSVMSDQYKEHILASLEKVKQNPASVTLETDDVSTLMIGEVNDVFVAIETMIAHLAVTNLHFSIQGMFNMNCPITDVAESDEPALTLPHSSQYVSSQFYLFPMGVTDYIPSIREEIEHAKSAGVFNNEMTNASGIHGDLSDVLLFYKQAVQRNEGHAFLHFTMSVNSPSHSN